MAPKKKGLQVPAGPLTLSQAASLALDAVGAPVDGDLHDRVVQALQRYVAEAPAALHEELGAEQQAVEQLHEEHDRQYKALFAQLKQRIVAARRELWELEVAVRRLHAEHRPLPGTTRMWQEAVAPQPKPDSCADRYRQEAIYPGGHEGFMAVHPNALPVNTLAAGMLRADGEQTKWLEKRTAAVKKRTARLTLARAVLRTRDTDEVLLGNAVSRFGLKTLTLDTAWSTQEARTSLSPGRYTFDGSGQAVRERGFAAYLTPLAPAICEWSTRALCWLQQQKLGARLTEDTSGDAS